MHFLCIGGKDVKKYYKRLKFLKSNYFEFAYFPKTSFKKPINSVQKKIRFIFVGQFIKRKGIDLLLDYIEFLNNDFNGCFSFSIVGNGPYLSKLEEKISLIGSDDIILEGLISKKTQLDKLYQKSDILFIPSYFDGWGAIVNEGLSNSLILLTSNKVYASKNLVKNNFNGFIFDPHDFDALKTKTQFIFKNKKTLFDLKKNCEKIYNVWNYKNASLTLYNHIINKNVDKSELLKII
jgi:glycosyltransferase involved in cell wall biosynthesis